MLIDWFTVGAQALNFLILVWLMKRFLYKPILRAIDEREKRIAAELADADQKRADAAQAEATLQAKNTAFDEARADLLAQATDDAQAERKRLLEAARAAADALGAKRAETLQTETRQLHQALRRTTQDAVFAISRRALGELGSVELEERLVDVFLRRLRELDETARTTLADALAASTGSATVRTAFELPAEQRAAVQEAVNVAFSADVSLRFEIAPDRISGIEFATNGQKLAWSLADYLGAMEKSVDALFQANDKPAPQPVSVPAPESVPEPALPSS